MHAGPVVHASVRGEQGRPFGKSKGNDRGATACPRGGAEPIAVAEPGAGRATRKVIIKGAPREAPIGDDVIIVVDQLRLGEHGELAQRCAVQSLVKGTIEGRMCRGVGPQFFQTLRLVSDQAVAGPRVAPAHARSLPKKQQAEVSAHAFCLDVTPPEMPRGFLNSSLTFCFCEMTSAATF